jgi:TraC-like protein
MAVKTKLEIQAEIEKLRAKLKKHDDDQAMRVGRLAQKAGLFDHEISDDDYLTAFQDLGKRFQEKRATAGSTAGNPAAAPDQSAST